MSNEEIIKLVNLHLKDGRLIEMRINPGLIPTYIFVFEAPDERRGYFSFQPALETKVSTMVQVVPTFNCTIQPFLK